MFENNDYKSGYFNFEMHRHLHEDVRLTLGANQVVKVLLI